MAERVSLRQAYNNRDVIAQILDLRRRVEYLESLIPPFTAEDAGKVLRVGTNGQLEWVLPE